MRLVIQRVLKSSVCINNSVRRGIDNGILVFIGIENLDTEEDINWLVGKLLRLRIFNDSFGVMNKSILDVNGEILLISQFTLHASTKKGNRPSYERAAKSDIAVNVYYKFIERLEIDFGKKIVAGEFGADMQVELINDGPVTITIDSKNKE